MGAFDDFLLSGVSQLSTGLINNSMSRANAREQREWQERMWQKQNKYNDPSAMAARMRAAGLNPFAMTGAEPAGNAGAGSMAQTIPISDPLSTLKVFAEYDNLVAQTGRTETETAKLLKDITMLDLLYEKGLLEKDEYEYRLGKKKEAYDKANPYELENEKTASEIEENEAQAAESSANAKVADEQAKKTESDRLFTEALTATENAMRDVKIRVAESQAAANNASAAASVAQASKLMLEGKTLENQLQRDSMRNAAMKFYGFDPTTLPNELSATLMNNYASVVEHNFDETYAKRAMDACHKLLEVYRDKAIWTPTSNSYSWNNSVSLGAFSISSGQTFGSSN